MSLRSENVDRLSHLRDEVLGHILSLMPTKFALRTSTLSKKWRDIWTLVTNLDFDGIRSVNASDCFSKSVDRIFELCKTSQLRLFRLPYVPSSVQTSYVLKWINEAVRLNVCEVDIKIWPTELPLSLFNCKTLTKLRLDTCIIFIPSRVKLPGLKVLDITIRIKQAFIISRFVYGCPLLESLSLEIMWCDRAEQDCNINIPTLKRLELRTRNGAYKHKFVLNVPNLECLVVGGDFCPHIVMEDLSSAVEATVSFSDMMDYGFELLKGLSGVKSLSLSISLLTAIILLRSSAISSLPKFHNLKHLELKGRVGSQEMIVIEILESCFELDHLCLEEPTGSFWIEPLSVPTCMLSNLKTIKITRRRGRECDIRFLECILSNAEVLKRLTIICDTLVKKNETGLRARLLKIPKAFRIFKIHFVGKWLKKLF